MSVTRAGGCEGGGAGSSTCGSISGSKRDPFHFPVGARSALADAAEPLLRSAHSQTARWSGHCLAAASRITGPNWSGGREQAFWWQTHLVPRSGRACRMAGHSHLPGSPRARSGPVLRRSETGFRLPLRPWALPALPSRDRLARRAPVLSSGAEGPQRACVMVAFVV